MCPCRRDWEPPDRKVDTRRYRAEPRSIFQYEPGKSSALRGDRTVRSAVLPPPALSPHAPSPPLLRSDWPSSGGVLPLIGPRQFQIVVF